MINILIHPDLRKKLEKEFGVTAQYVRMCLRYHFESEQADKVRKRAKELLQAEADKVLS